jgi:HlyD family secretion protein
MEYKNSESITYLLQGKLNGVLRYGMYYILLLAVMVFVGLYFIKVPDTLEGKFTLSSTNPPKALLAKINGRITHKLIHDKQQVIKGQRLLILENLSSINEIDNLSKYLNNIQQLINHNLLDSITKIDTLALTNLGEIQNQYEAFKKANNELYLAVSNRQYQQQKAIILNRLASLKKINLKLVYQKELVEKEYQIACENYTISEYLFKDKSISITEFRNAESSKIRSEQSLNSADQALIGNETTQNDINDQLINLEKNLEAQKNNFIQSFQFLHSALSDWESKYLVISPFNGQVNFNKNIFEGLQLQAGESLLYISPAGSELVCEMMVPQINFGKLKNNLRCIIKFDSYNFEEYGILQGYVFNISDVPTEVKTQNGSENMYLVQIAFKNGLETSYHKQIQPRFGLTGVSSIILEDKSVLEKLFLDKFKALFVYQ